MPRPGRGRHLRPVDAIQNTDGSVSPDVRGFGIPVDRLPDETLLAGLATGDEEIAVAFVRRFQRAVFGVAFAVLGDPRTAEDVAQQTFERAWRHAQVYDSRRGSVRTWLTTIAHNLAIDVVRARRPMPLDPTEIGTLVGMVGMVLDTPERHAIANENSAELHAQLTALPREQARAVVLAGIYGMTAQQIAEFERIPLGTAKTRIRTAMIRLRAALSRKQADHD
jgi:RNA polymerase sigma factor (sigma-70 family)